MGVLIGLAATVAVVWLAQLTWPNYLELKCLDQRLNLYPIAVNSPQSDLPEHVVLVIDDNSLEQIGRWPWPRRYIGDLVDLCRQAGAVDVLLDIIMPEEQRVEYYLPGVTDVSSYEPPGQIIGGAVPRAIDNDALLADELVKAGNVTVPFHAQLYKSPEAIPVSQRPDQLYQQVAKLLGHDEKITFEQVYGAAYPQGDLQVRDQDYHQLLLAYIQAKATQNMGRFGFLRSQQDIAGPIYHVGRLIPPIPRFAQAANNCGFVSVEKDKDGVVRRVPLLTMYEGKVFKQIAFAMACRALAIRDEDIDLSRPRKIVLGDRGVEIPLDEEGKLIISWTGNWEKQPGYYSITHAARIWQQKWALQQNRHKLQIINDLKFQLSTVPQDTSNLDESTRKIIAEKQQLLSALGDADTLCIGNEQLAGDIERGMAEFKKMVNGKIVLVGSVATGAADDFEVTPCNQTTPGIVIHRNILNTILQYWYAFNHRPGRGLELLAIVALGILITVVTAIFRPLVSGLTMVTLVPVIIVLNYQLVFGYGRYWFAVVSPIAAMLASFAVVTFYRQITEGHARRQITARFKQYASPALVDQIVRSSNMLSFAGEMKSLSCLFSDLAGFTPISERLGPQKTVSLLNLYLDRMTEVLDSHEATINKFQGDGIFAFYGAPIAMTDHARRACLTALDSQRELAKLIEQQRKTNTEFPELFMRVGISTGPVIVGDCGSQRRFDYTAIGDTVNLGARLESANKAFGSSMMICHNTFQEAGREMATRYLGNLRVVGKKIAVGVYELLGRAGDLSADQQQYVDCFETAVKYFQKEQFQQATKNFQLCLELRPADKAVLLYLQITRQYMQNGTPDSFDGGIELTEK